MKVKWKTKTNKIPAIKTSLKGMNDRAVIVGALEGDHKWLAGIHEYGCNIPVTPKMRAFLHSQGLHLKQSTTVIKIPERSFLRATHDKEADRILTQTERAISLVLSGEMSVDDMIELYGQQFVSAIKRYMRDLSEPENHPFTVDQKGSANPLVGTTGHLIESITWKEE